MNQMKLPYIVAGLAVGAAVLWVMSKGGAKEAGEAIGGALVDATDGVLKGTVTSVGQLAGIPATSMTECEKAKAEGRTLDASFACPATDFLKYVFN